MFFVLNPVIMLLRLLSLSLLCLLWFNPISAQQNLVPNPSFEDTTLCPNIGQLFGVKYWEVVENTPDYFHECCVYYQFSVPENQFSYQWAATGQAYMGLCNYTTIDNFREVIGVYLTEPLSVGQRYFVNFKVSMAYNPNQGANVATNKLGMLFSMDDFSNSSPPRNNHCQVYAQQIISDTTNWIPVSGAFIADSAYRFISISNFFSADSTDTLRFYDNNWYQSYYFIDDVCVSTDSMYCEVWTNVPENVLNEKYISIHPIPAWRELQIDNIPYDCTELQIINTAGQLIQKICTIQDFKVSLDISTFPEGVYNVIFKRRNHHYTRRFIKSF